MFSFLIICTIACTTPRKANVTSPHPSSGKIQVPSHAQNQPIDTIHWHQDQHGKPPIGGISGGSNNNNGIGKTYRIALLLPFLTNQLDTSRHAIPEKSRYAVQFYGGAQLAFEKLSMESGVNFVVDVLDTRTTDADFTQLLNDPRIEKEDLFIGPIRSSQLTVLANRTKNSRQIILSPESPNEELMYRKSKFCTN